MTVLAPAIRPQPASDLGQALAPWPLRLRGAAGGAFAVCATLVALCLPVLLAWVASPDSSVGWGSALGVAASGWLLGLGVDLHAGAATVSLTPLLLTAGQLTVIVLSARHVLLRITVGAASHRLSRGRQRRAVYDCAAGFVSSYAALGVFVSLGTHPAGVRVSPVLAFVCATGWSTVGFAYAASRVLDAWLPLPQGAERSWRHVPAYLGRAVTPAIWGVAGLLTIGGLLVLASVLAHLGAVAALSSSLGGGLTGQLLLGLVQLAALPDLALWALSWMAGPGFSLAVGSSVTWSAGDPGMLPVIPVLGALPPSGPMPGWAAAAALAPACVGVLIAWRSGRSMSALTSWRFRAQVTGAALLLCVAATTVLTWLSSGSLGAVRLASVGPPALLTGAALLGEVAMGAALGCAAVGWRARRRVGDSSPS